VSPPRTKPPAILPFNSGPNAQIRPYEGHMRKADVEMPLYDSLAAEQVRSSGTRLHYFSLNVEASTTNPVYDESTSRAYAGPYEMQGYIEWPKSNPEVRQEGLIVSWQTRVWVPRVNVERARCPLPLEGDIVQAWRTPFFDQWSVVGDEQQPKGYYFVVITVNDEGHLYDDAGFVGFELTVQRATDFTPERRMDTRVIR
jgi:hypothetical protein